jgi:hypothetical protein
VSGTSLRLSIEVGLDPGGAFAVVAEELASGLARREVLKALGREAGFEAVQVERRSLERFAREAGVPEEALPLFAGEGPRFLFARKG